MPIPELLTTLGGEKITNTSDWETYRRPEIMNLLAENIYGHRPAAAEKNLNTTWNVLLYQENYLGAPVRYQKVNITSGGYTFLCRGFFPMTEAPVPTFVYIMHEYQENKYNFEVSLECLNVPILDIVSRGYGVAIMPTSGLYPDANHIRPVCSPISSPTVPSARIMTGLPCLPGRGAHPVCWTG